MKQLRGQKPSSYSETKAKREYREAHSTCEACGIRRTEEAAHIVSKGSGGPAEDWNLLGLCWTCHEGTFHRLGWLSFCHIYPHLAGKITAARIRCGRKVK
jgi:hypothetical protein